MTVITVKLNYIFKLVLCCSLFLNHMVLPSRLHTGRRIDYDDSISLKGTRFFGNTCLTQRWIYICPVVTILHELYKYGFLVHTWEYVLCLGLTYVMYAAVNYMWMMLHYLYMYAALRYMYITEASEVTDIDSGYVCIAYVPIFINKLQTRNNV